jgi:hypothetical protein
MRNSEEYEYDVWEVKCDRCQEPLVWHRTMDGSTVEPCDNCLKESFSNGYDQEGKRCDGKKHDDPCFRMCRMTRWEWIKLWIIYGSCLLLCFGSWYFLYICAAPHFK